MLGSVSNLRLKWYRLMVTSKTLHGVSAMQRKFLLHTACPPPEAEILLHSDEAVGASFPPRTSSIAQLSSYNLASLYLLALFRRAGMVFKKAYQDFDSSTGLS
jgi:hypothetical protein